MLPNLHVTFFSFKSAYLNFADGLEKATFEIWTVIGINPARPYAPVFQLTIGTTVPSRNGHATVLLRAFLPPHMLSNLDSLSGSAHNSQDSTGTNLQVEAYSSPNFPYHPACSVLFVRAKLECWLPKKSGHVEYSIIYITWFVPM